MAIVIVTVGMTYTAGLIMYKILAPDKEAPVCTFKMESSVTGKQEPMFSLRDDGMVIVHKSVGEAADDFWQMVRSKYCKCQCREKI